MPFPCTSTLTPPFPGSFLALEWRGIKSLTFQVLLRYTVHGVFMQLPPPPPQPCTIKREIKWLLYSGFQLLQFAGWSVGVKKVPSRPGKSRCLVGPPRQYLYLSLGNRAPIRTLLACFDLVVLQGTVCCSLGRIQSCPGFSPFPTIS